MAGKITDYTPVTELLSDTDLLDVTVDVGGTPTTKSVPYSLIKGVDEVAFANTVDCGAIATTAMTWRCSGKEVGAMFLSIRVVSAAKGIALIKLRVNKNSNVGDVIQLEQLNDFADGNYYFLPIMGLQPALLSDSDTYNLEITVPSTGTVTCDFKIHAIHESV